MGLGISSMASVWLLLVCGANSELLGLAFKHPDHPTTTLFQTFLVLPQWPPSVCSTNYTASFFISLLVLLLSPTTSTLPRPLESLLIIKGNSTNLKGRRKRIALVFGILWGMWLTERGWGKQISGMERSVCLKRLGNLALVKGDGEKQVGGQSRCSAWGGKKRKRAACRMHMLTPKTQAAAPPGRALCQRGGERKELKSNSMGCGRRAG